MVKVVAARRILLVLLLMLGLAHAWYGHDYLHGHHHQELGEASYSTSPSSSGGDGASTVAILPPCLQSWRGLLAPPLQVLEVREPETLVYHDPLYRARSLSPRPPPRA